MSMWSRAASHDSFTFSHCYCLVCIGKQGLGGGKSEKLNSSHTQQLRMINFINTPCYILHRSHEPLRIPVGAYFLSNSLRSTDRKFISHLKPCALLATLQTYYDIIGGCSRHQCRLLF